jgi:hypothetical protein
MRLTIEWSPIQGLTTVLSCFAPCSLLLAPCSLLLAPCSLLPGVKVTGSNKRSCLQKYGIKYSYKKFCDTLPMERKQNLTLICQQKSFLPKKLFLKIARFAFGSRESKILNSMETCVFQVLHDYCN